jgi:hypothetical protein
MTMVYNNSGTAALTASAVNETATAASGGSMRHVKGWTQKVTSNRPANPSRPIGTAAKRATVGDMTAE